MKIQRFTSNEWQIILHRLQVDDSIFDSLLDNEDYSKDDVEFMESAIKQIIKNGQDSIDWKNRLVLHIMVDTIDGSTFMHCMESAFDERQITRKDLQYWQMVFDRTKEKIKNNIVAATLMR